MPRALIVPPGIPDFWTGSGFSRRARQARRPCLVRWAPITRVEVSVDGGQTWGDAELEEPVGEFGWHRLDVLLGRRRAGRIRALLTGHRRWGNVQPSNPTWNYGGYVNNAVQRVLATVRG